MVKKIASHACMHWMLSHAPVPKKKKIGYAKSFPFFYLGLDVIVQESAECRLLKIVATGKRSGILRRGLGFEGISNGFHIIKLAEHKRKNLTEFLNLTNQQMY